VIVDREAPRKQRHIARRVWQRLVDEHGVEVSERQVCRYVRVRRRELGEPVDEVFVPQVHEPGVEAEVDWGEAVVEIALRSHYLFESAFTRRGREGAHEKGGVEGEVGRFRRRYLVPVPKVGSLKELNDLLEDGCFAELERRIAGRDESVREALRAEMRILRPLPVEEFETAEPASPRRREGAGHGPAKPLLGPGRACRLARRRPDRRARDRAQPPRPRARPPPAPAWPLPDRRQARPLPRVLAAQAGRAEGVAAAAAGARAWPLAALLRRALAADRGLLRRLRGGRSRGGRR
jgi:hypothetical protein